MTEFSQEDIQKIETREALFKGELSQDKIIKLGLEERDELFKKFGIMKERMYNVSQRSHDTWYDIDVAYFTNYDLFSEKRKGQVMERLNLAKQIGNLSIDFSKMIEEDNLDLKTFIDASYVRFSWGDENVQKEIKKMLGKFPGDKSKSEFQRVGGRSYESYVIGLMGMREDLMSIFDFDVPHAFIHNVAGHYFADGEAMPGSGSCSHLFKAIDSLCPIYSEKLITNKDSQRSLIGKLN